MGETVKISFAEFPKLSIPNPSADYSFQSVRINQKTPYDTIRWVILRIQTVRGLLNPRIRLLKSISGLRDLWIGLLNPRIGLCEVHQRIAGSVDWIVESTDQIVKVHQRIAGSVDWIVESTDRIV